MARGSNVDISLVGGSESQDMVSRALQCAERSMVSGPSLVAVEKG